MADPERARPDSFTPPESGAFAGLDLDHRYGGLLPIQVTPSMASFPIAHAVAYIDGQVAGGCGPAPCALEVDTEFYEEGPNEISLVLQRTDGPDPELGLLNLVGAGALVLTGTVVFDQSPPTPADVESVQWTEDETIVRWSLPAGSNLNARSVTLLRAIGETGSFDAIAEADAVGVDGGQFVDTTAPRLLGQRVRYAVRVWNGRADGPGVSARETADSETFVTSWAPILDGPERCNSGQLVNAPGVDRILYLCGDTMWGGSIREARFTSSAPVPGLTGPEVGAVRYLTPGLDGEVFYIAETRYSSQQIVALATVNATTLAIEATSTVTIPVPFPDAYVTHVVADGGGTVYFVSISPGKVFAVDAASGEITRTLEFEPSGSGGGSYTGVDFLITPDGRHLLRAGWDLVQSIALTGGTPGVKATMSVGEETHFAVDEAGRFYTARNRGQAIQVFDSATLTQTGLFGAGEPGSNGVVDLWGAPNGVFAESSGAWPGDESARLVLHGANGARQDVWPAASSSFAVLSGENEGEAVVLLGGFVVSLPPAP